MTRLLMIGLAGMKVRVEWVGGVAFCAESGGGHRIVFDGPAEFGGENRGARPMEGLLAAAAACSAFDVLHILRKGKCAPDSLAVEISGERAEREPRVFTAIHLRFVLRGDVRDSAIERAIALSVEKYCSALAMLNKSAAVTHSWERFPSLDCPPPTPPNKDVGGV